MTKKLIKSAIITALAAIVCVIALPLSSFAKAKTPVLDQKAIYLEANFRNTKVNVYNASSKPKWTIANKKIANISVSGGQVTVNGLKGGTTTLTCKVGSKKLTCKVIVRDSKEFVKKKSVPYTIKKLSSSVCAVTINNKNNFPVVFTPGVEGFDSQWCFTTANSGSLRYCVPAKTKITVNLSFYQESYRYSKSDSRTNVVEMGGNVYLPKNVSVSKVKIDSSDAYATLKNKNTYPVCVNAEFTVYKKGKALSVTTKGVSLKAGETQNVKVDYYEPYGADKGKDLSVKVRLINMGSNDIY